jgi:hypothetical protein
MKNLILRQYQIALSKENAVYVFRELYFKHADRFQVDDSKAVLTSKVHGFKILRKLGQYNSANEILKMK